MFIDQTGGAKMKRIEEFTRGGKNFVYIDFSGLQTNEEISRLIEQAKLTIHKNSPKSIYTITNFERLHFNKESKDLVVPYTESNKPYVIAGAIIGMDGLKKVMATTIFSLSGRKDLAILSSKEEAIQHLLDL